MIIYQSGNIHGLVTTWDDTTSATLTLEQGLNYLIYIQTVSEQVEQSVNSEPLTVDTSTKPWPPIDLFLDETLTNYDQVVFSWTLQYENELYPI